MQLIKEKSDSEDKNQIFFDSFLSVLKKFKITLSEKEKDMLLFSFPGRDEG